MAAKTKPQPTDTALTPAPSEPASTEPAPTPQQRIDAFNVDIKAACETHGITLKIVLYAALPGGLVEASFPGIVGQLILKAD